MERLAVDEKERAVRMTNDVMISDLQEVSEILKNNGYGGFCESICKAVALLKEPEPVKPHHKCSGGSYVQIECETYDFCPFCGKPILWEGR